MLLVTLQRLLVRSDVVNLAESPPLLLPPRRVFLVFVVLQKFVVVVVPHPVLP